MEGGLSDDNTFVEEGGEFVVGLYVQYFSSARITRELYMEPGAVDVNMVNLFEGSSICRTT